MLRKCCHQQKVKSVGDLENRVKVLEERLENLINNLSKFTNSVYFKTKFKI